MSGFIETIESLSKSQSLRNGSATEFARLVLQKSVETLQCARVNAWKFNDEKTELISICSIESATNQIQTESPLIGHKMPNYFKHLKKNEIIVSNDARTEAMNEELLTTYLLPNDITSMIDVPLRSDGEMIGVICFEHVGEIHHWVEEERSFTQSVAQLLSLALETETKYQYRLELERLVNQKQVLLNEINHRVKNNLAIIVSLLNLQRSKASDQAHALLFEEVKDKVFAMSLLQHQLHVSNSVDKIELGTYVNSLVQNLQSSYSQGQNLSLKLNTCEVELNVAKAIPLGLISNEILTNSFKYAFKADNSSPELEVTLSKIKDKIRLEFSDNGPGYNPQSQSSGMGLELVYDLVEQIGATISVNTDHGTATVIELTSDLS